MLRNRSGLVALTAVFVFVLACHGAAEPPQSEQAGQSGQKVPDSTVMIGGRPFDPSNLAQFAAKATKFLGRWQQTNQWGKVGPLATLCREHSDRDLQALGAWYLTLIEGQEAADSPATRAKLLSMVKEAVGLGYKNPQAIESADQLATIRDSSEFKKLVADLKVQLDREQKEQFQRWVGDELARNLKVAASAAPDPLGLAGTESLDGGPVWNIGRPSIFILARIHHDGFAKLLPRLADAVQEKTPGTPVSVFFYQYFAEDFGRIQQTKSYVKQTIGALGVDWKCAVVGRERYEAIVSDLESRSEDSGTVFLPVSVALDKSGVPVLSYAGVLFDWQAQDIASRLGDLPSDPLPPPPEEEEPAEEEPAPEPVEEEPAPEPVEEEPAEEEPAPEPVEEEPAEEEPAPEPVEEEPAPEPVEEEPAPEPVEEEPAEEEPAPEPVEEEPAEEEPAPEPVEEEKPAEEDAGEGEGTK